MDSRKNKIKVVILHIENELNSVGVKMWRKKSEDRSVWAVILKEVLVQV